ncbi:MAG: cobalamin-dependent protein [Nanoarchaeota archaeon]|nr:cobalamin-dependent protein [Nanoarchaeota archaeon]
MKRPRILLIALNDPDNFTYSLSLGYIQSYMQKHKKITDSSDVRIINFNIREKGIEFMLHEIIAEKPDVIGFSCYTWNISTVLLICEAVKKDLADLLIILGGPEVSELSSEYLKLSDNIDIIVRGEGEATFVEILSRYINENMQLERILGISYRINGKIYHNEKRPLLDLNEIPSPYLNGIIDPAEISPAGYIEFCRGCKFSCDYCYEGNRFDYQRYFSLERVKAELQYMKKHNIKTVAIIDATMNSDTNKFRNVCKMMSEINLQNKINISVELKAELLEDQMFDYMKSSGISMAGIGLQSSDNISNENIGRYFDRQKFEKGISILNKAKIKPYIDLICGLPGDNFFKFIATYKFAINIRPYAILFFNLNILQGTRLNQNKDRFALVYNNEPPYEVISNYSFPAEEVNLAKIISKTLKMEYNTRMS